eukprot:scaffold6174_cov125-Isochrysis_galbana.AAC.13
MELEVSAEMRAAGGSSIGADSCARRMGRQAESHRAPRSAATLAPLRRPSRAASALRRAGLIGRFCFSGACRMFAAMTWGPRSTVHGPTAEAYVQIWKARGLGLVSPCVRSVLEA